MVGARELVPLGGDSEGRLAGGGTCGLRKVPPASGLPCDTSAGLWVRLHKADSFLMDFQKPCHQ